MHSETSTVTADIRDRDTNAKVPIRVTQEQEHLVLTFNDGSTVQVAVRSDDVLVQAFRMDGDELGLMRFELGAFNPSVGLPPTEKDPRR